MQEFLYIVDILNTTEKRSKQETFFCEDYKAVGNRLISFLNIYTYRNRDFEPGLLEWVIDLDMYSINIRKRSKEQINKLLREGQDV